MYRNVTASQLKALIAVVETGGFSLGARRLGLAQPTVHRAAKDLEGVCQCEFFRRAARGIEPTEAAQTMARFARLTFGEVRQAFEEVAELQGNTNSRVALGCLPLARSEFLPAVLTELLRRFPNAQVNILDGPYIEQLHALRYGQIDWLIGALRDPAPTGDIAQEKLFEQPLAVVVRPGHPMLAEQSPDARQLAKLEWVVPRHLSPARSLFAAYFENNDLPVPQRFVECSSLVATRGLVQRSDRAALLSPLQVRHYVDCGQLATLVAALPNTERSIGITTRDNWQPTHVQAEFADIVRAQANELRRDVDVQADQAIAGIPR